MDLKKIIIIQQSDQNVEETIESIQHLKHIWTRSRDLLRVIWFFFWSIRIIRGMSGRVEGRRGMSGRVGGRRGTVIYRRLYVDVQVYGGIYRCIQGSAGVYRDIWDVRACTGMHTQMQFLSKQVHHS